MLRESFALIRIRCAASRMWSAQSPGTSTRNGSGTGKPRSPARHAAITSRARLASFSSQPAENLATISTAVPPARSQTILDGRVLPLVTTEWCSIAVTRVSIERIKVDNRVQLNSLELLYRGARLTGARKVRQMHQAPENAGALFQVASQFNLLEMVSPTVTPEDGVTRYQQDRTLRPAGAATIYRNYFAPLGGGSPSPDCALLRNPQGSPDFASSSSGLRTSERAYGAGAGLKPAPTCIGLHRDVEVTEAAGERRPVVSQAFCSALPVA